MLNVQVFLKVLYGDKEAEKEKEKKDKFEVDFLKKYNKKMSILKVIAVILFIVVLCTWALTIASLIKIERTYTKSKYIYEVLNEAYGKIEEVQTWSVGNITDEDLKVEGFTNEEMEEMNKNLEEHFYSSFIPMYLILK